MNLDSTLREGNPIKSPGRIARRAISSPAAQKADGKPMYLKTNIYINIYIYINTYIYIYIYIYKGSGTVLRHKSLRKTELRDSSTRRESKQANRAARATPELEVKSDSEAKHKQEAQCTARTVQ